MDIERCSNYGYCQGKDRGREVRAPYCRANNEVMVPCLGRKDLCPYPELYQGYYRRLEVLYPEYIPTKQPTNYDDLAQSLGWGDKQDFTYSEEEDEFQPLPPKKHHGPMEIWIERNGDY